MDEDLRVARGTKLFHCGHVEVSRRVSRMTLGGTAMVVVARTVKAGLVWAPQWGVGMGGVWLDWTLVMGTEGGMLCWSSCAL